LDTKAHFDKHIFQSWQATKIVRFEILPWRVMLEWCRLLCASHVWQCIESANIPT
jgi:hypothetical protein